MTRIWTGATGLISLNAVTVPSSYTFSLGISPDTMRQEIYSFSTRTLLPDGEYPSPPRRTTPSQTPSKRPKNLVDEATGNTLALRLYDPHPDQIALLHWSAPTLIL